MAYTWQFYVAMILIFLAIVIFVALIFLLFNPANNVFDGIAGLFRKKKKATPSKSTASRPSTLPGPNARAPPQGRVPQRGRPAARRSPGRMGARPRR
jgi:hypothetical protein